MSSLVLENVECSFCHGLNTNYRQIKHGKHQFQCLDCKKLFIPSCERVHAPRTMGLLSHMTKAEYMRQWRAKQKGERQKPLECKNIPCPLCSSTNTAFSRLKECGKTYLKCFNCGKEFVHPKQRVKSLRVSVKQTYAETILLKEKKPQTVDSLIGIPCSHIDCLDACLHCDPTTCEKLEAWLMNGK